MNWSLLRKFLVFVGDVAALYLALFLMIRLSYGADWSQSWHEHLRPFSWIFPIWITTFYATYLYETRFFRFGIETLRTISAAVAVALMGSVVIFYAFPPGLIHPRRDMVLFASIFILLFVGWRWLAYRLFRDTVKTRLVFLGDGKEVKELTKYFREHPQLGYISKGTVDPRGHYLDVINKKVRFNGVRLVVVNPPRNDHQFTKRLFTLLSSGVTIINLEDFYERVLDKIAPSIITDTWFIENLESLSLDFYRFTKRVSDIAFALVGLILTLPLYPIVALIIKLDSKGPILFRQDRVGKNGRLYRLYKFRSMEVLGSGGSAEREGPEYATPGDSRITRVGKILRVTHMDELPQLWNVLGGAMSLVGPRPIRPEFVDKLSKNIPYYDMRHLVKPGLTGWAQINYGYGITIKDEYIKLQYDIYYAKKQSLVLDIAIILRTLKLLFTRQGQ